MLEKTYAKVKGIVHKCRKDYYLHLWEKDDWNQEGMICLYELLEKHQVAGDDLGTFKYVEDDMKIYLDYLTSTVKTNFSKLRIVIDTANGAAYRVASKVFQNLGADVIVINNIPNGKNINVNCGSTHPELLQEVVKVYKADLGLAYDGDADRCLAVDERGHVVDGDLILYVCGCYLNKYGRLAKQTVVTTVMSNFGLFKAFEDAGLSYEKTDVGDKNVYACMNEHEYSLGGEQSGHIIFGDLEKTGDGIMTSLRIMEVLRAEREKLSELVRPVRLYPQQLINVRVTDKNAAIGSTSVTAAIAAAEKHLEGDGRVLVRASGTEPLIRVLAEASSERLCQEANDIVLKSLEPFKCMA